MEAEQVRLHWQDWARRFKTDLRATTKSPTAKRLELAAISRAFERFEFGRGSRPRVLEVGCGNGINCLALAQRYPGIDFVGMDYVPEMIELAEENLAAEGGQLALQFHVGDLRKLPSLAFLGSGFDCILSNRCLINLAGHDEQLHAVRDLLGFLTDDGHLLLIENSQQNHARQNDCREKLGLPRRSPAEFNVFIDECRFWSDLEEHAELAWTEDFMDLHDLLLYVLLPAANDGVIDYEHPLVELTTQLSLANPPMALTEGIGQNRLFVLRKKLPLRR